MKKHLKSICWYCSPLDLAQYRSHANSIPSPSSSWLPLCEQGAARPRPPPPAPRVSRPRLAAPHGFDAALPERTHRNPCRDGTPRSQGQERAAAGSLPRGLWTAVTAHVHRALFKVKHFCSFLFSKYQSSKIM